MREVGPGSAAGAAAVAVAVVVAAPAPSPAPHGASGVWTTARPVTTLPGWEVDPAVSPDGSLVAFASNASGSADIWLVEAAGGEPRQLTDVGVPQAEAPDDLSPTWLPDGRSILFSSDRTGQRSIFRVSFLGEKPAARRGRRRRARALGRRDASRVHAAAPVRPLPEDLDRAARRSRETRDP